AIERFAALGFPTLEDEDWRFTPLAPLTRVPFQTDPDLADGPELMVPGGVIVCDLVQALAKYPELVEPHLARHADFEDHAFTALNPAFLPEGPFVHVPAGRVIEEPIRVNFAARGAGDPLAWPRRLLVVLGRNSQATLCETYSGQPGVCYFTNA